MELGKPLLLQSAAHPKLKQYSTVQVYYPLLRGSRRRTSAEVKLAKMKTQPKMSRHGSGGEAARVTRFARARASGSAWAMRPP